jgi:hypothetical protein
VSSDKTLPSCVNDPVVIWGYETFLRP